MIRIMYFDMIVVLWVLIVNDTAGYIIYDDVLKFTFESIHDFDSCLHQGGYTIWLHNQYINSAPLSCSSKR